jgi:hypothetical protein
MPRPEVRPSSALFISLMAVIGRSCWRAAKTSAERLTASLLDAVQIARAAVIKFSRCEASPAAHGDDNRAAKKWNPKDNLHASFEGALRPGHVNDLAVTECVGSGSIAYWAGDKAFGAIPPGAAIRFKSNLEANSLALCHRPKDN